MKTPFELHLNFGREYLVFEVTKHEVKLSINGSAISLTLSQLNDIQMAAKIVANHAYHVMENGNG